MLKKNLRARPILPGLFIFIMGLILPVASWTGIAQAVGYSCNESGLNAALAVDGTATFNCTSSTTIVVSSTKTVAKNVTLDGGNLLTISGGNARQIFIVNSTKSLTIQNMIVRDALANSNGGAIRANYNLTTVSIINSQFINNRSTPSPTGADFGGGAIFSQGGTVNVTNSQFSGNIANGSSGGAIHGLRSNISISNSTFTNNQGSGNGGYGGAIYYDGAIENGFVTIQGSTFTGNTANGEGGAVKGYMYQKSDYTLVDRSSFINNSSSPEPDGHSLAGALKFGNGKLTVTNSLFSGNVNYGGQAGAIGVYEPAVVEIANTTITGNNSYDPNTTCCTGIGGGVSITNNTTPFKITNSTIVNNHASWGGGGISGGPGIISNTIVANNTADNGGHGWNIIQNCTTTFTDGGNNIQYPAKNPNDGNDKNCVTTPTIVQPMLGALASNGGPTQTMALLAGSPAINTGSNATCAASPVSNKDQRGVPRPSGANCDIGAFEVAPKPTISKAFSPTHIIPGAQSTLTFTLTNPNSGPLSGLTFSDTFPGGLVIASPASVTNTCSVPGTVTANPGGSIVSVSGLGLSASQTCTISLKVTSTASNTYPNTTGILSSLEMGPGAASNTANLVVEAPIFSSAPTGPGGTYLVASSAVGVAKQANLTFRNAGNPTTALNVSGTLTGSSDITIAGGNFAFNNMAGGTSQDLAITCTPSALATSTATLNVTTNAPNLPTTSYTLKCVGTNLIVTAATDNGDGTPSGSLSQMLQQATTAGQAIIFDPAITTITVSGAQSMPAVHSGVIIDAGCGATGPKVSLDGSGSSAVNGLTLSGNNFIRGLEIKGFQGNQLVLGITKGHQLFCTKIKE